MFIEIKFKSVSVPYLTMNVFLKKWLWSLLFVFHFSFSFGQKTVSEVSEALAKGNISIISSHFDKAVSLSVTGTQATYSSSQAEMVLKDFFSKNPPQSFVLEQSKDGAMPYAIGILKTSSGNFRTYIAAKRKDGKLLIQEIRLEK